MRALAQIGPGATEARPALEALLNSPLQYVREAAADALVAIGSVPRGPLATVLNDLAVERHFVESLKGSLRLWEKPDTCEVTMQHGFPTSLPRYPWPPPRFSAHDVLPRNFLGPGDETLAAVHERLALALQAAGFDENGLFEVPGGFAIATRLERIRADGSSDTQERWTGSKGRPVDISDYLGRLFLQRPGQFRLIVFLVTEEGLADSGKPPSETWARTLYLVGARVLPTRIADTPLVSRDCHVLIYHFERRYGAAVALYPSSLSTREHLRQAGLWEKLAAQ